MKKVTYEEWSRDTHLTNAEGKRLYYTWVSEREKVEKLTKALEFYADKDNWKVRQVGHEMYGIVKFELEYERHSKVAKEALECNKEYK